MLLNARTSARIMPKFEACVHADVIRHDRQPFAAVFECEHMQQVVHDNFIREIQGKPPNPSRMHTTHFNLQNRAELPLVTFQTPPASLPHLPLECTTLSTSHANDAGNNSLKAVTDVTSVRAAQPASATLLVQPEHDGKLALLTRCCRRACFCHASVRCR